MILFIDDEPRWISTYIEELSLAGVPCRHVATVDEAIEDIAAGEPKIDLVVVDIMMPAGEFLEDVETRGGRSTGFHLIKRLRDMNPELRLVTLTNVRAEALSELRDLGVPVYLKGEVSALDFASIIKQLAMEG